MRNLLKISSTVLGLMVISSSIQASQSNFQVSPPPIAAPEFSAGKMDKKASATYVGISGSGFNLDGAGGNFIVRQANSDTSAIDFSGGIFVLSGKLDSGTTGGKGNFFAMNFPLSLGLEYQPVKNESTSVILFGGPMMNLGVSSFEYSLQYQGITGYQNQTIGGITVRLPVTGTVTDTYTTTSTTLLYGIQGGVQGALNNGNFTFAPFAMFQSQQGTGSASTTSTSSSIYTTTASTSSTIDIPSFTSISYGLDILYRPWNMTLSSMLQEASKSGSNEGFKTTVISLNWTF